MIKAIIFDSGGVLFREDVGLVPKKTSKILGFDLASFLALSREYNDKALKGEVSFADVLKSLKESQSLPHSMEEILSVWEHAYFDIRKENKPLFSFIKKLRKKYVVALVSNIYDLTAAHHRARGHFVHFDPCILSCEVGLKKPDEKIFHLTLQKLSLKPQECVFIDDQKSNYVVAEKFGFHAVQFINNKKLFSDLKSLGVVA